MFQINWMLNSLKLFMLDAIFFVLPAGELEHLKRQPPQAAIFG